MDRNFFALVYVFAFVDLLAALYWYFSGHTVHTGFIGLALLGESVLAMLFFSSRKRSKCTEFCDAEIVAAREDIYQGVPVYYVTFRYADALGNSHEQEINYASGPAVRSGKVRILKPGETLAIRFNPQSPGECVLDKPASKFM